MKGENEAHEAHDEDYVHDDYDAHDAHEVHRISGKQTDILLLDYLKYCG